MRVRSGASHKPPSRDGYAGLALILVMTGLVVVTVLLAPSLVPARVQARQFDESARIEKIAQQLLTSIRANQYIPGPTNWSATLGESSGMNRTAIEQVYPDFPDDTTTRRILLFDPSIAKDALPYSQSAIGLSGTLTNLAGSGARALLISNTRRGLTLPVTSGFAKSSSEFNAIWDWTLNTKTKAPPSGWPTSWNGYGDDLHVARINLANLFHSVTLKNLRLMVDTNRVSLPILAKADLTLVEDLLANLKDPLLQGTRLITSPVEMKVLNGTLIKIYDTNGVFHEALRVTKNTRFEFEVTNSTPPVVHYKFLESSGAVATNSGTYGSSWNGVFTNGVTLGQSEPRPPSFPSFSTNNLSTYFDGNKSYVETGKKLTNFLPAFTLAAWIRPEQISKTAIYIAGVRNSLNLSFYSAKKTGATVLRVATKRGSSLAKGYPYPLKEWHHVAAVGTGTGLRLYVDGILLAQKSFSTANYFYDSGYTFVVGASPQLKKGAISWGSSPQYKGGIDEVVFYDRALDTNELVKLAAGIVP